MGGETFCPHDGTKLVDARELSPGELTGSRLDDSVRLDKLAYSDPFAERYTGRLLESRRAVYVTVFNQSFRVDPSAKKRVETARAKVGSPMPPQINTLLRTHFDKAIPYLVESEPRGPSVRTLLDEKRTLDWPHAVRIIANVARAMQWLHEQGVAHCSFHPTAIFVTNLQRGEVVVGDWALEALFPPDSAERLVEEDPDAFAGYLDYMAPEIARATEKADIRSAVYALGCVLYEMILGRVPLPGKSPGEVLKRHRHEKPVRLSIAVEGQDLPGQLDDIVEMMLAKDPDKRFQSPAAAVAALSNLVDEAPDTLAPQLQRADETDVDDLYRTIDMESVDREALEDVYDSEDDIASKPTLMMGSGVVATAELKTGAVKGESATNDVDDTSIDQLLSQETRSTGQFNKPAAVAPLAATEDATDESVEVDPDARTRPTQPVSENAKQTLALGSLSALATAGDDDDDSKKTLIHFGSAATDEEESAAGPPKKMSRKQKKAQKRNGKTDPDLTPVTAKATDETIKVNVDAGALERQLDEPSTPMSGPPANAAPPPSVTKSDAVPTASEKPSERATISLDADEAAEAGLPDGKPNIGFITPDKSRDATRDIDRSSWFSGNTDDVWESSLAQEHAEYSERSNKKIVVGIVSVLVLIVLGFVAWVQFFSGVEEGVEDPVAAADETEPDEPKINLDEIVQAFDEALEAGRIVQPIGNAALTHLESLKRHAPDDERFEATRKKFVEAARTAAKQADEANDLRAARSLAGYASQYAPEDEELKSMTADFQARFTGAAAAPDVGASASADAGSVDAGAPDLGTTDEPVEEPPVVAEKPKPDKPKPDKPRPKKPKKWDDDKSDAASLAREAHMAHKSGNLDQARKLYSLALKADSQNTKALAGLGKVYFEKADYRSAVKYQTKAVRYAPTRNDYRINLGQSYYRLGKYSEAISVWEKVLARDPNNSTARQYVELAKRKMGK